jgi:hypothetical protein
LKVKTFTRLSGMLGLLLLIVVAMWLPHSSLASDKLKPEEIVAKNLDSIGTAEARAAARNRIVGGSVVATFAEPVVGKFTGRVVMASDGDKNLISMDFDNSNYTQENLMFNGKEVLVGFARAGVRSNLGDLLYTYKPLLKTGLIGGELSQAWPLYDLANKKGQLSGGGTKKIEGKDAYEITYMPKGGSDMTITMFFDAQTFQHIRTEYLHIVRPQIGLTIDSNKSQNPSRYRIIEDFSEFSKEGDLTLPHTYKLTVEADRRATATNASQAPFRGKWEMTFEQFGFNQPIPPETFSAVKKS